MVDGHACSKGIRVYLLSERALATLLPESSTVYDNLKIGIQTRREPVNMKRLEP